MLVQFAKEYAEMKHDGQKRKYTGEPYFNHLEEVATILSEYTRNEYMIAAAYLHDVLEDTPTRPFDLSALFPPKVVEYVIGLTDISKPEDGNRAVRKKLDRQHLHSQSNAVQIIKCADIISNTSSIKKRDPHFAKVYLPEIAALLDGMNDDVKRSVIWRRARTFSE